MCCGQNRQAAAASDAPHLQVAAAPAVMSRTGITNAPTRPAVYAVDQKSAVTLQCRHRSPLTVVGPATGKRYQFLAGGSMQAVDAPDAEALLATGLFRRVWG